MGIKNHGINVVGYASLTVTDSAEPLVDIPAKANRAFFTVETSGLRWRGDGTAPTSSEGHALAVNDSISFTGANYRSMLDGILFITTTSDSAVLKVTYFD